MIQEGEYDEELFSQYLSQIFRGVFENELTIIDQELAKYEPEKKETKEKEQKKLECFIIKNHTSAHARAVGGACVSGDNPDKAKESDIVKCLWNLPNYFQMVLRDSETKICQGIVLLHFYEDQGKSILTASFNPCSTYLYQVNESQLFMGLLSQLTLFAKDNNIDIITTNRNEEVRTNRRGGEFELAIKRQIKKIKKKFILNHIQDFSFNPDYQQKDLDIIWENEYK